MGKQWQTLFLGGFKITSDGDCSHKLKIHLLLGRIDSILKSRDIPLPTKVHRVKVMIFPLVMYVCEHWAIKNAECQRIDAFELWCWRRLEIPLDCKEIQPVHPNRNQSWVFIGRTDIEAETPTLGHLMRRADSFEKTLILGQIEGQGRRGRQRMRWLVASLTQWTWVWVDSGSWWWAGRPGVLWFMGSQRVGYNWMTELDRIYNKKYCAFYYCL